MLASNIHVVHEEPGLQIETAAAVRITMGNENAIASFAGFYVGLDEVASAAHVRRDVARQMPHPAMEDVALTGPMEPVSIDYKAFAKPVVERQHLVFLGFLPPKPYQIGELLGLPCGEIVGFRKIFVDMEQLPFVVLVGSARRMIRNGLPTSMP